MLTDGLVEFWTLNNTLVGAVAGNTLVSPDGLTHYVAGKIENAWDVADVINQVLRQTPGPINPGAVDWTLSYWVYVDDHENPTTGGHIGLRDGTTLRFLSLFFVVGEHSLYIGSTGIDVTSSVWTLVTGWNHVVVTCERDAGGPGAHDYRVWVNGVKDDNGDGIGLAAEIPTMTTPNLYVGGNGAASGTSAAWEAEIDAIGWWNRLLSDAEVLELWNGGDGWELSPVAAVITNILLGSTVETCRILNSRIVRGPI